jgi:hypothetical protein
VDFVRDSELEPVVLDRCFVTQFEVPHVELVRKLDRAIDECLRDFRRVGHDAGRVEVRQTDQKPAEEF